MYKLTRLLICLLCCTAYIKTSTQKDVHVID